MANRLQKFGVFNVLSPDTSKRQYDDPPEGRVIFSTQELPSSFSILANRYFTMREVKEEILNIKTEWTKVSCTRGQDGSSCVYFNDYRIIGPKPWGGGSVKVLVRVRTSELRSELERLEQEHPDLFE